MNTHRNGERRPADARSDGRRIAEVFREFAGAFSHLADFRSFFSHLEACLDRTELFDEARVRLVKNTIETEDVGGGGLFIPVGTGVQEDLLLLKGKNAGSSFGADDLHLLASLGDLIASMAVQARRMGILKRKATILDVLLGRLPVGVIVCSADHRVLSWNQRATDFLGESVDVGAIFRHDGFPGDCTRESRLRDHSFHFSSGHKLFYVECCHALGPEGDDGTLVYVIADLSEEARNFEAWLAREFYRCGWLGRPMSLILMRLAGDAAGAMKVLARVRGLMGPECHAGVRTGDTIGVIVPGKERVDAGRLMREAIKGLGLDALEVCATGIGAADREPEEMLARAEAELAPASDWIRNRILIFDGSRDVTDTLEYVLSGEYRVVKCDQFERAIQSVRADVFDGLITEIEARDGRSGIELARIAVKFHPEIRTILTTTGRSGEAAVHARRFDPHPVIIEKPFNVSSLREKVKACFSDVGKG